MSVAKSKIASSRFPLGLKRFQGGFVSTGIIFFEYSARNYMSVAKNKNCEFKIVLSGLKRFQGGFVSGIICLNIPLGIICR
jgi:hypothetical protein